MSGFTHVVVAFGGGLLVDGNARIKNFIGNILAQMIATGVFSSIAQAREAVFNSFDVKKI